nr:uncharacterized protein LOC109163356 [Ipomoea batatas]
MAKDRVLDTLLQNKELIDDLTAKESRQLLAMTRNIIVEPWPLNIVEGDGDNMDEAAILTSLQASKNLSQALVIPSVSVSLVLTNGFVSMVSASIPDAFSIRNVSQFVNFPDLSVSSPKLSIIVFIACSQYDIESGLISTLPASCSVSTVPDGTVHAASAPVSPIASRSYPVRPASSRIPVEPPALISHRQLASSIKSSMSLIRGSIASQQDAAAGLIRTESSCPSPLNGLVGSLTC